MVAKAEQGTAGPASPRAGAVTGAPAGDAAAAKRRALAGLALAHGGGVRGGVAARAERSQVLRGLLTGG